MDIKRLLNSKINVLLVFWLLTLTGAFAASLNSNVRAQQELVKMLDRAGEVYSANSEMDDRILTLEMEVENKSREVQELGKVMYYIGKLSDKDFIGSYGHGYTWYAAAEELGKIGKPAVPYLVENLQTKNDYERTVTFYALMLATQHDNVKELTKGDYINLQAPLEFNARYHPEMKRKVDAWWEKYKGYWDAQ